GGELVLDLSVQDLVIGEREEDDGGLALSGDEVTDPSGVILHQHRLVAQARDRRSLRVDVLGDGSDLRLVRARASVAIDSQEGVAVRGLEVGTATRTGRFTFGEWLDLLTGDGLHICGREHVARWLGSPALGHGEEDHPGSKKG